LKQNKTHTYECRERELEREGEKAGGSRRRPAAVPGGGTAAPRRPATAGGGGPRFLHIRIALDVMSKFSFISGDRFEV
jgi:hypothetical protein